MASPSVGAAVDVGSTSVHLAVAGVHGNTLVSLYDELAFLGLGATVDTGGFVGEPATAELVTALRGFAGRAAALGAAGMTVVGTEPMRRALDAPRVVRAVERDAGLALHVITHEEEALLTLLGVTAGASPAGVLVVIDIGGGSTEIVVAAPGRLPVTVGLRLGASRLTAGVAAGDPPSDADFAAMLEQARAVFASAPAVGPAEIVAVGGTAANVLKVVAGTDGSDGAGPGDAASDGADAIAPPRLSTADLAAARTVLLSLPAAEVAVHHLVRPIRARLLPAGVAILLAVMERYEVGFLRVSTAGVREGAILAAARAGVGWRDRLAELATAGRPPDPAAAGTSGRRRPATMARPRA